MKDDNTKSFLNKVKDFWTEITTRESQVVKNNNADEIEKNNKKRSGLYRDLIVMFALGSVFWSGAKKALSQLKGWVFCVASVYINFALISMMVGAAAGTLPDVFRCHMGLSGNGVLQGLLFNIIAFNYELFTTLLPGSLVKLSQRVMYWVTGATSAIAVTVIWTLATEDPLAPEKDVEECRAQRHDQPGSCSCSGGDQSLTSDVVPKKRPSDSTVTLTDMISIEDSSYILLL
uniref:Uncharacterized protein n=1 Tax=Oryza barthii TaxID=65489 RepID=A0A0D3HJ45_9ORYZ